MRALKNRHSLFAARKKIRDIYNLLYKVYGPRNWWPASTAFEVIVGAILTQNTSWRNVEKAIENLKKYKKLSLKALCHISESELALLIKPCGYYNIKARRLKAFINYLFKNHKGSLRKFFLPATANIRKGLLSVNGIGPETADSILLYAAGRPVFVVDAYTKRIFHRQALISDDAGYEQTQRVFEKNLPRKTKLFNEYHALIVEHAKNVCRKKPLCSLCVIKKECAFRKSQR